MRCKVGKGTVESCYHRFEERYFIWAARKENRKGGGGEQTECPSNDERKGGVSNASMYGGGEVAEANEEQSEGEME